MRWTKIWCRHIQPTIRINVNKLVNDSLDNLPNSVMGRVAACFHNTQRWRRWDSGSWISLSLSWRAAVFHVDPNWADETKNIDSTIPSSLRQKVANKYNVAMWVLPSARRQVFFFFFFMSACMVLDWSTNRYFRLHLRFIMKTLRAQLQLLTRCLTRWLFARHSMFVAYISNGFFTPTILIWAFLKSYRFVL